MIKMGRIKIIKPIAQTIRALPYLSLLSPPFNLLKFVQKTRS